jgi:hypothetical protein
MKSRPAMIELRLTSVRRINIVTRVVTGANIDDTKITQISHTSRRLLFKFRWQIRRFCRFRIIIANNVISIIPKTAATAAFLASPVTYANK